VVGEIAKLEGRVGNVSRVLTFRLGGKATLPPGGVPADRRPEPPASTASPELIAQGEAHYYNYCFVCHGDNAVSGSTIPDLRYMDAATHQAFAGIVMGARADKGMPSFAKYTTIDEITAIHAYLIDRADAELARLAEVDAGSN
jgi:quinohemoprotein ethanol dehydrogenase